VIDMGDAGTSEHFLSYNIEWVIGVLLTIYGYFYAPIGLVEKYKFAMPKEVGSLLLSTGILFIVLSIMAKIIYNQIYNRKNNQNNVSNNKFIIIFLIIILSLLLFEYTRKNLELAFCIRHDHLFSYFFENYLHYIAIYYLPLIFVPLIYDNFDKLRIYLFNDSGK